MAWLIDNHNLVIHAVGTLLLFTSEALGLRKDPGKAKGIVDAILKKLGRG